MSGDINSLGHQLNRLSERNRHYRDFTLYSLIAAIKELIACFPVYRTYITAEEEPSAHDRLYIARAVRCASRRAPASSTRLRLHPARPAEADARRQPGGVRASARGSSASSSRSPARSPPRGSRTPPSTSSTGWSRLNEVGADPTRFGLEPTAVHAWMCERQRHWPSALSATSTHDTKRGEDMRARLNVLSEMSVGVENRGDTLACAQSPVPRRRRWHRGPGRERRVSALSDARRRLALHRGRSARLPGTAAQLHAQGDPRSEARRPAGSTRTNATRPRCFGSSATSSSGTAPSCRRSCHSRRASPSSASTTASRSCSSRSRRPACLTSIKAPSCGICRWSTPTTAGRSTTSSGAGSSPRSRTLHRRGSWRTGRMAASRRSSWRARSGSARPSARSTTMAPTCRCRSTAIAGAMCLRSRAGARNRWRLPACRGSSPACSAAGPSRRSARRSGGTRASSFPT